MISPLFALDRLSEDILKGDSRALVVLGLIILLCLGACLIGWRMRR